MTSLAVSLRSALVAGAIAARAVASEARGDDTVAIAPLDEALTFARAAGRLIAVTEYRAGRVSGVDLGSGDPISLLDAVGWDGARDRVATASDSDRVVVDAHTLDVPVDLRDHHVAAGTNYPEHAGEAEVDDGPFLFPKLVQPTPPRASVPVGDALLDYEVELAWVTLAPVAPGETPSRMGLVLCNDYTDRATLLRLVDVWDPTSG
jgi:2-keto-4-pentenoate hydratase/2-oxohepta-3-ene-1,7-dioic acid hydratase in catechol pathway